MKVLIACEYSGIVRDAFSKSTCLWSRDLPLLKPTGIVDKGEFVTTPSGKRLPKWYSELSGKGKERSCFSLGIAQAMADQWGCGLKEEEQLLMDF